MAAILYQLPVEKQRFSRILCGFFHLGTSKAHKNGVFRGCRLISGPAEQLWQDSQS
jgi:hypothetical protein